jgi:hypothetical protein
MLFAVEACVFRPGDLGVLVDLLASFEVPLDNKERRKPLAVFPAVLSAKPFQGAGPSDAGRPKPSQRLEK